jgi:hypothetical protein
VQAQANAYLVAFHPRTASWSNVTRGSAKNPFTGEKLRYPRVCLGSSHTTPKVLVICEVGPELNWTHDQRRRASTRTKLVHSSNSLTPSSRVVLCVLRLFIHNETCPGSRRTCVFSLAVLSTSCSNSHFNPSLHLISRPVSVILVCNVFYAFFNWSNGTFLTAGVPRLIEIFFSQS